MVEQVPSVVVLTWDCWAWLCHSSRRAPWNAECLECTHLGQLQWAKLFDWGISCEVAWHCFRVSIHAAVSLLQAVLFIRDVDRSILGRGKNALEHYKKLRRVTDLLVNGILCVRQLLKQKRAADADGAPISGRRPYVLHRTIPLVCPTLSGLFEAVEPVLKSGEAVDVQEGRVKATRSRCLCISGCCPLLPHKALFGLACLALENCFLPWAPIIQAFPAQEPCWRTVSARSGWSRRWQVCSTSST